MKIKVLFFASCRDAVGHKSCDWEIAEGYRVADLQRELVAAYPQLAAVQQVLSVAVNAEYVGDHTVLKAGDEVALIPPVSGGWHVQNYRRPNKTRRFICRGGAR
ncbi:MAG: molybdopterin converting factor subunit 1 [Gemmatimonadetes bacterium]|nr:molybdopterin converting factor subunit 1 [Gemmatimonadota bacterium]